MASLNTQRLQGLTDSCGMLMDASSDAAGGQYLYIGSWRSPNSHCTAVNLVAFHQVLKSADHVPADVFAMPAKGT